MQKRQNPDPGSAAYALLGIQTPPAENAEQGLFSRLSGYRDAALGAISDGVKSVVPASARAFVDTFAGNQEPITEQFFRPDELEILRATAERALNGKQKASFGYGDYGERDPWAPATESVVNALRETPASLAYTLGMANVERAPNGDIIIRDEYDFGAKPEVVDRIRGPIATPKAIAQGFANNGLLGVGNVIGNLMAPQGSGRPVEVRIPKQGR